MNFDDLKGYKKIYIFYKIGITLQPRFDMCTFEFKHLTRACMLTVHDPCNHYKSSLLKVTDEINTFLLTYLLTLKFDGTIVT